MGWRLHLTCSVFSCLFSSPVGDTTALTTTRREVFAFSRGPSSRDEVFPFSRWLSKIEKQRNIPFSAVHTVSFWSAMRYVINIGSTTAFKIIISLTFLALRSTYMVSIACLALKQIRGEPPHRDDGLLVVMESPSIDSPSFTPVLLWSSSLVFGRSSSWTIEVKIV